MLGSWGDKTRPWGAVAADWELALLSWYLEKCCQTPCRVLPGHSSLSGDHRQAPRGFICIKVYWESITTLSGTHRTKTVRRKRVRGGGPALCMHCAQGMLVSVNTHGCPKRWVLLLLWRWRHWDSKALGICQRNTDKSAARRQERIKTTPRQTEDIGFCRVLSSGKDHPQRTLRNSVHPKKKGF